MAMIGGFGVGELVLIVIVLLLLFGAKRIPEIGRGVGGALRNFKGEMMPDDPGADQERLPPEDPDAPRD